MKAVEQIESLNWDGVADELNEQGFAVVQSLLSAADCKRIMNMYDDPRTEFRSTVDMARHNFGRGEYKYFAYPLPTDVQNLRAAFYPKLARIANEWSERFCEKPTWPNSLAKLTARCRLEGQSRPTPLMLRYGEGDYNCLHQDLYGPLHFPMQIVILLSSPATDFAGGELVLVEQRSRAQSRPLVVPLQQGGAAIIPVRERPRRGAKRIHRAQIRHGVGEIRQGTRTTLGLIFHDAK